ncbi:discoidin domain-containing protein [Lentisphaera araneosa]|nr:discoidin domain-containing protein [Lentisphaera araneosa]
MDHKNDKKRWSTNEGQKVGHWLSIELDKPKLVNGINMNHGRSKNDYAPKYKIETSLNGKDWQSVGEFKGTAKLSIARFKDTEAKFIRLSILEKKGGYWSIHELDITGKEKTQKTVSSL